MIPLDFNDTVFEFFNSTSVVSDSSSTSNATDNKGERFCTEWYGTTMALFQTGNAFHLAAFVVPHNFIASSILMRFLILTGQILYMLWAAFDICAADIFAWNLALVSVNLCHVLFLTVKLFPPLIPDHLKDLFVKLFQPLKVNRRQFRCLVKEAEVKWLEPGEFYAEEETTPADQRLSILLQGKVKVTCDSAHLHYVFPNQFIDSPEWEAAEHGNADNLFQVSLVAEERSRYITWSRPRLKLLLTSKPFLKSVVSCLIGKDITTKLYSLNEYQNKGKSSSDPSKDDTVSGTLMHRSRSADTVHMGSTGFIRSDLWQKAESVNELLGGTPGPKRPNIYEKTN